MISTTPQNVDIDPRPDIEIIPDPVGSAPWDGPPHRPDSPTGPPDSARGRYRVVVMAAAVALALAVIAGSIYYVTSSVTVTLAVDGAAQPIETRASTVADLLDQQQLVLNPADLVVPALDTELDEGARVEVRYARPITVTIDGVETVHTTTELTVGEALASVGAPIDGAAVSSPLDQALPLSGTAVTIITPKQITVDDGGQPRPVTTTAATVGDLLADAGMTLSDTDTVSPSLDAVVTAGITVTVTRIRIENEVRVETIAHDTSETKDGDLTVGTSKVDTEGVDGEKEVTYAVTFTNGEQTAEEILSTEVTKEPVTEVVRVGTKPAPVAAVAPGASAGGDAAGLNWAALAQCESSGNPRAVNPAGYYGLYQFSLSTWRSVGGSGNPIDASVEEQTMRAQILYNKAGAGQWPHCGPRLFS